jgi:hypothetical protein
MPEFANRNMPPRDRGADSPREHPAFSGERSRSAVIVFGLAFTLFLATGCTNLGNVGGGKDTVVASSSSVACVNGFRNATNLPTGNDADPIAEPLTPQNSSLWQLWHISQRDLSTKPIPYLDGSTSPPLLQAASEPPNCQTVVSVPDLSPQELASATSDPKWLTHTEPTGAFVCSGIAVSGCYKDNTVYVVESVAYRHVWEMENAILCRYDQCSGR